MKRLFCITLLLALLGSTLGFGQSGTNIPTYFKKLSGVISPVVSTDTLSINVTGDITGNVTGNVSGSAATVTGAAQTAITSLGTLTGLTVNGTTTTNILQGPGTVSATGTIRLAYASYIDAKNQAGSSQRHLVSIDTVGGVVNTIRLGDDGSPSELWSSALRLYSANAIYTLGLSAADNSAVIAAIKGAPSTTNVAGASVTVQAGKGSGTTYGVLYLQPDGGTVSSGGQVGVSVSGASCTVKAVTNGLVTSATCP